MLPAKQGTKILALVNSIATRYLHATTNQEKQLGSRPLASFH